MGRLRFVRALLVSVLLVFSFSQGFGRKAMETDVEYEQVTAQIEEVPGLLPREMTELMDYSETGPNTNPRTGYIFTPPPQG
ncbi:hypothetical protein SLE2022_278430 [Rubroshorea leprosula]